MKTSLLAGALLAFTLAAALLGVPFSTPEAQSQTTTARPIEPVRPVPIQRRTLMPPIEIRRVDIAPVISIAPQTLQVQRIQLPQRAIALPAVAVSMRAVGPGPGPTHIERESPDCSVHELRCAQACDPLPEAWSSSRACVNYYCKQVDESCLEKLAEELDSRTDLTISVDCQFETSIQLEFYSQARNVAWPGDHQAYIIHDSDTHVYKLRCNSGEKICYGAWSTEGSQYWGAGWNGRHHCDDCCTTCNGGSVSFVLQ